MTDQPLEALPPTFVPDWFVDYVEREAEETRADMGNARTNYVIDNVKLVMQHLTKFMADNDLVFARRDSEYERDVAAARANGHHDPEAMARALKAQREMGSPADRLLK